MLGLSCSTQDLQSSLRHEGSFSSGGWDLVPWPGIELSLPVLETRSLSHWTTSCCCLVDKSCLTLCDSMDCSPARHLCPWDFLGKSTGVGGHLLLQGIFPAQGLNWSLLHWQVGCLPWSHEGNPWTTRGIPIYSTSILPIAYTYYHMFIYNVFYLSLSILVWMPKISILHLKTRGRTSWLSSG